MGPMRLYLNVCLSVRNKRRRQYHQIETKFLLKKPKKISNQIANCNF